MTAFNIDEIELKEAPVVTASDDLQSLTKKTFLDYFLPYFSENERLRVSETIDDYLMPHIIHIHLEDLLDCFPKNLLKSGTVGYKEFASVEEIKNWSSKLTATENNIDVMMAVIYLSSEDVSIYEYKKIFDALRPYCTENATMFYSDSIPENADKTNATILAIRIVYYRIA